MALVYDMYYFLRVKKPVVAMAGPMWERSRQFIELDITYACNLNCFKCNRSSGHAQSSEHISLDQIKKFIEESKAKNMRWKRIRLLGGGPTLHPQFFEILDEILAFKKSFCPTVRIEVTTNGLGKRVNKVLARMPAEVFVNNTAKTSRQDNLFNPLLPSKNTPVI